MMQSPRRSGWTHSVRDALRSAGIAAEVYSYEKKASVLDGREMPPRVYDLLISRNYPELNDERVRWYPDGTKVVPRDLVLTPLTLTHWFCGDGRGGDRKGTLGFCTDGFTVDDVDFLVHALQRDLGITALRTINHRGHPQILIGKRDEACKVRDAVSPHIPKCCLYKLEHVRPLQETGVGRRLPDGLKEAILADKGSCSVRTAANRHGVSVSKVWKLWQKS